ncbi:MAG TPA: enoyl-CoA hydratase/isomerase family protein [Myxococcales bacterium]|nr:enoyl-CoA hydratase/isomerase family protein [Myxococcales bacterium]
MPGLEDNYEWIRIEIDAGVAWATVDNPPINLITLPLFAELMHLGQAVAADDAIRVLVLRSANPEFFLAHFDVEAILGFSIETEAVRSPDNPFHQMCECFRLMDKATVAQIEGRVGGGGSELAAAFDMRFGVVGQTVINQMEVPVGILPGGGGTQRLPRMLGRGRALEVILGGIDLDAETAERWGYLNRALPAEEIGGFVDNLARRMAAFPPEALRLAKRAVNAAEGPLAQGLIEEDYLFQTLLRTPEAPKAMKRFLELGGQTRQGELRVAELSGELAKKGWD